MRDKCQIGEQNNQIPLRNSPPKTAKKKLFTVLDTIRGTVKRKCRNQSNQMAQAAAATVAAAAATTIGDSSPHRAIVNKHFVPQNVVQIKIEHNNQRDMLPPLLQLLLSIVVVLAIVALVALCHCCRYPCSSASAAATATAAACCTWLRQMTLL